MDNPGPYKRKPRGVLLRYAAGKDWDAKHKDEHLRLFNPAVMSIVTIHETPATTSSSSMRNSSEQDAKIVFCGTNVEGQAQYAEQMMIEEASATAIRACV
jgi:hypothetical protein